MKSEFVPPMPREEEMELEVMNERVEERVEGQREGEGEVVEAPPPYSPLEGGLEVVEPAVLRH